MIRRGDWRRSPEPPQDAAVRSGDSGFSVAELLINVVILGFLSVGLAQVFAVVTRTLPQAEAQADDARSLTGLSIWLPEDLSSTPSAIDDGSGPGGIDVNPATPTGCAGASPGTNLLRARWTEQIGFATVTWLASYRYVSSGNGHEVERHACSPGGTPKVGAMTGVLTASPLCPLPPGERLVQVELVSDAQSSAGGAIFTVRFGCRSTEVRGLSNNPDDALDPVFTTTTLAAPATTAAVTTTTAAGATTTTIAGTTTTVAATTTTTPPPCTGASILSVNPSQANNGAHEDVSELNKDIVVTISWTGYCPSLGILFDPWYSDGSPSLHSQWQSMKGATTITLLGRGGDLWSDGVHTIKLLHGASSPVVLSTATLTVL